MQQNVIDVKLRLEQTFLENFLSKLSKIEKLLFAMKTENH